MLKIKVGFWQTLLVAVLVSYVCFSASTHAVAGSWSITYNTSGTSSGTTNNGQSVGPQNWGSSSTNGSYQLTGIQGSSSTITCSGTITATLTWVPDPSLPSDPAPPSVYITESASASFSGPPTNQGAVTNSYGGSSVNDGLGDSSVTTSGTSSYSMSSSSSTPHLSNVSGGSITRTCSIGVTGNCKSVSFQGPGSTYTLNANWSYAVGIHAQPYNFHLVNTESDNSNGVLTLNWAWNSTSGHLSDLTTCSISENVDFSNNSQGSYGTDSYGKPVYFLPSPPATTNYNYANPTINTISATSGNMSDVYSAPSFAPPNSNNYTTASWSGFQHYYLNDTFTGQQNVDLGSSGSIDRAVTLFATGNPNTYKYSVSSRGYTAYKLSPF